MKSDQCYQKIELKTLSEESSDLMDEGRSVRWTVSFLPLPNELGSSKISLRKECLILSNEIYEEIFIPRALQGDFILIFEETLVASRASE